MLFVSFFPTILSLCLWLLACFVAIRAAFLLFEYDPKAKWIAVTLLTVVSVWAPLWRVYPGITLVRAACEREGGPRIRNAQDVEGVFFANMPPVSYDKVVEFLARRKFQFIELDRRFHYIDVAPPRPHTLRDGEEDIVRYYIAPTDAPACQSFNRKLEKDMSFRSAMLHRGLPPDLCIAAERTSEALSSARIDAHKIDAGFPAFLQWDRLAVTDARSGAIHAELNTFNYRVMGTRFVGQEAGWIEPCHAKADMNQFLLAAVRPAATRGFLDAKRTGDTKGQLERFYEGSVSVAIRVVEPPNYEATQSVTAQLLSTAREPLQGSGRWHRIEMKGHDEHVFVADGYVFIVENAQVTKAPLPVVSLPDPKSPGMSRGPQLESSRVFPGRVLVLSGLTRSEARQGAVAIFTPTGKLTAVWKYTLPAVQWVGRPVIESIAEDGDDLRLTIVDEVPREPGVAYQFRLAASKP